MIRKPGAAGMPTQKEHCLIHYFLGDQDFFPLEKRILNALILASSLLSTLLVLETLAFGYSKALILSSMAAALFWTLFIFSRSSAAREWPLWAYFTAIGFVVSSDWFFVGGQTGLALLVLVAIAAAIPLITRKEQLKTCSFLFVLAYGGICILTAFYWHKIPTSTPTRLGFVVQLMEVGILISCLYAVASLAITSYRREKSLISTLNVELYRKNDSLEQTNHELELANKQIKTLRGLLATCSYCNKVRPDNIGPKEPVSWLPIEKFIEQNSDAKFSHGICPDCVKEHFGEELFTKVFIN
jgi:hypothetical protein